MLQGVSSGTGVRGQVAPRRARPGQRSAALPAVQRLQCPRGGRCGIGPLEVTMGEVAMSLRDRLTVFVLVMVC
jgi:hypothetical protein